eukprot:gnl/TRDRNA2_/TRDRNA2_46198_c0_seq1.p1 gnl/TRDRNA2_/TRDRNA2_46198_c0~~gnl/TRDRNA2_/TRDRNA2_46198_c0_seq1.p1  ORF type:complete len:920 (-),score=160.57 gnl/TRDRNA2_/TRDRNA2_46198_c0_seq1:84-2468(-)
MGGKAEATATAAPPASDPDDPEGERSALQLRGLPYRATVEDVRTFLGEHAANLDCWRGGNNEATVGESVRLVFNRDGRPSGFARVQLNSPEAARRCRDQLHLQQMDDRYVEVFLYSELPLAKGQRLQPAGNTSADGAAGEKSGHPAGGGSGDAGGGPPSVTREQVARECRACMTEPGKQKMLLSALGTALSPGARAYLRHLDQGGLKHFLHQYPDEFSVDGGKGAESVTFSPQSGKQRSSLDGEHLCLDLALKESKGTAPPTGTATGRATSPGTPQKARMMQQQMGKGTGNSTTSSSSLSSRSAGRQGTPHAGNLLMTPSDWGTPAALPPGAGLPWPGGAFAPLPAWPLGATAGNVGTAGASNNGTGPSSEDMAIASLPLPEFPGVPWPTPGGAPGASPVWPGWPAGWPGGWMPGTSWGSSGWPVGAPAGLPLSSPPDQIWNASGRSQPSEEQPQMPLQTANLTETVAPPALQPAPAAKAVELSTGNSSGSSTTKVEGAKADAPSPTSASTTTGGSKRPVRSGQRHLDPQHHPLAVPNGPDGTGPPAGAGGDAAVVRLRGLPFTSTEQDVLALFAQHDVVDRIVDGPGAVSILLRSNGRPSGQAVVRMNSRADAELAQALLHGSWMGNRYVEVFVYGGEGESQGNTTSNSGIPSATGATAAGTAATATSGEPAVAPPSTGKTPAAKLSGTDAGTGAGVGTAVAPWGCAPAWASSPTVVPSASSPWSTTAIGSPMAAMPGGKLPSPFNATGGDGVSWGELFDSIGPAGATPDAVLGERGYWNYPTVGGAPSMAVV